MDGDSGSYVQYIYLYEYLNKYIHTRRNEEYAVLNPTLFDAMAGISRSI